MGLTRSKRVLLGALVALWSASTLAQDFDPRGRKRGTPKPPPASGAPARPKPAPQPKDKEGGAGQGLLDRYTRIVIAQPGAPFPLQRLAQLYRDKDGNISGLVKDFETRAAQTGPEQYAATVTLAGIYKLDGRPDDSVRTYEKALAMRASDPAAILALARLLQDRSELDKAQTRYEQALALQTAPADKEQTLRTLMTLSLERKDWAQAKAFHTQLVKLQSASLFVKGELGREFFTRGEYERAEAEFKDLVQAAAGDNRALAPALRDLGRAQAKAGKSDEAQITLKRGLAAAGAEAAVRAEIYETIAEIFRADQRLPVLIKQLEAEHPSDFPRLLLLGSLYEETGETSLALTTYRRALAANPRHIDLRLKVIRLLQSQGELDKAIAEYEGLIRAAPNNPAFVFEQCEALMQRGDRARALRLLTELEARARGDEEVLSRLAEFYGRIGEGERSTRVLQHLTQVASGDPSHLVDLGDRYFQDGNTQLALQTWRRILTAVTPRAKALATIGEVYLEHDMIPDALVALREAVQLEPGNLAYKKQLASAFERARNTKEARDLWLALGDKARATGDKLLAREARSRIVALWGLDRSLDAQVGPLSAKFQAQPPDVDAGRMLSEVLIHLRRYPEAEVALRRVVELSPGDGESYLSLERVLVQQSKLADAILVLEKLIAVEPKRARELYQRMSEYALSLRRDNDAIQYAARAVELNPDDAEGHRRLAERYRQRQETDKAIVEYRAALSRNDRLWIVYFDLADLLLSRGETAEADRLFRRVLRGAPDEELVARAARQSMQINIAGGTLAALEQELLPVAIGNPQRSIYRRLLVELYGSLTFGLVQRARHGAPADADDAKKQLARIGARAIKPLLDALGDSDSSQQRIAIDVLSHVENKNASLPLFTFATGPGDAQLRTRAMIASGALKDPALLSKYDAVLFPKGGEESFIPDSVAVAAAWSTARMGDKRALPLLRKIANKGTPEMRAFALLGLGSMRDRGSLPLAVEIAKSGEAGYVARAAAAYALGELGGDAEQNTLLALAESPEPLTRQMALLALTRVSLARHEPAEAVLQTLAEGLFAAGTDRGRQSRGEMARWSAAAGLIVLANRKADAWTKEPLRVPEGSLSADATLSELVPRSFDARERAQACVQYAPFIERAAKAALETSADRARVVLMALSRADGEFPPFVSFPRTPEMEGAVAKVRAMAQSLEPSLAPLARHPDLDLRTKAVVVLARLSGPLARDAIASALNDSSEDAQRMALAAIGPEASPKAGAAVERILAGHESWAMRAAAAQALGRMGASHPESEAALARATTVPAQPFALVREAAIQALAAVNASSARKVATTMMIQEPEPRVRETARQIAQGK